MNVQRLPIGVPCFSRPAHGFEHDTEVEESIEVGGREFDGVPVGGFGPDEIPPGLENIAEIVVGIHEIRLQSDRRFQQCRRGGGIIGLETRDGAQVECPRVFGVFRQKRLAEFPRTTRVAALQEGRDLAESGIDVRRLRPGPVAFRRSFLTFSPCLVQAPLVFSVHD